MLFRQSFIILSLLLCFPVLGYAAATPPSLQQAIRDAIDTNPDVQKRWHIFAATQHELAYVRSGWRPQLDLNVTAGRRHQKEARQPEKRFNGVAANIKLSQMLYDGGYIYNESQRYRHSRMVRYFEMMSEAQSVALEAFRAYADVQRYRELVSFARDNYAQHQQVYNQIVERTRSGVGRGVDLELATGRLALAESNVLTDIANLHDVTARYLRIVGKAPARQQASLEALLQGLSFSKVLPAEKSEALKKAFAFNPLLKASVADIKAAQAHVEGRKAGYRPRLDFQVVHKIDRDLKGDIDLDRETRVELALNYNLYRGGGDRARLRQAAEELNQSKYVREKVCRDIRQTLAIALNDHDNLMRRLRALNQHRLSTEKAMAAYLQQFDIGQRTLLDLLDGQNERFDARRAYVNALFDKTIAQARALSASGLLLVALDVERQQAAEDEGGPLESAEQYDEADALCSPLLPDLHGFDNSVTAAMHHGDDAPSHAMPSSLP